MFVKKSVNYVRGGKRVDFWHQEVPISDSRNPLDANLEAVIPGLHNWHCATNAAIKNMDNKINSIGQTLENKIEALGETLKGEYSKMEETVQAQSTSMGRMLQVVGKAMENGTLKTPEEDRPHVSYPTAPMHASGSSVSAGVTPPFGNDSNKKTMKPRHDHFGDIIDEWYGTGNYSDELGGIEGRDKLHKSSWRKHIDYNHYSRTKRIVMGFKKHLATVDCSKEDGIDYFQQLYVASNKSICNMVSKLQDMDLIPKRKKRGRCVSRVAAAVPMIEVEEE